MPPRSPDLTPLDFYFRGFVKQIVYSVCIQHLKQPIREAAASVTVDPSDHRLSAKLVQTFADRGL
jgi:hypothetical protein